ncbi:MAG TPA: hypothetical protein VJJ21_05190 [Candidatus Nanoarchaeia archaeon]|nr:hypothetical protein [Candidatus Nanoarchaeia archaeon]
MPYDSPILQIARKIVKENPEHFEALVEFERTKKLPKLNYKQRANFTIDSEPLRRFRIYCQKHGYKMSTKLEESIMKELSE